MKLIAHRGIWDNNVKDNSYEALKKGLESSKYIGIECDVRQTLDKEFVIYHNALYKGNLVKYTMYKDMTGVCNLEDVLKIDTDKIILIEVKDFEMDINKFLKIINKYKRNIYIMSFDSGVIKKLKTKNTKYKLGVLNYVFNSDSNYDLDFICLLDIIDTKKIVESFVKRRISVIIYGTIIPKNDLIYIVDDIKISNN